MSLLFYSFKVLQAHKKKNMFFDVRNTIISISLLLLYVII